MADLTPAQLAAAGQAARAVLAFALGTRDRFGGVVRLPVVAVCRTAESDLAGSRAALEPLITPDHLKAHGFEDLWFLGDEVPRLAHIMPDLVGRLYVHAFAHDEEAGDATAVGTSRILSLRSTRRQDYQSGLFQLGERFEAFLRIAPTEAIGSLDAALRASGRTWAYGVGAPGTFTFVGAEVSLRDDHGRYWDDERVSPEVQGTMLRALDTVADGLASRGEKEGRLSLLRACASSGRSSSLWSRLLRIGARHPATWGKDLAGLATQATLLLSWNTTDAVGRFIAAVFPSLNAPTRRAVERAVTSLPGSVAAEDEDRARAIRDRILLGIGPDRLRTAMARRQRENLVAAAAERVANRPDSESYGVDNALAMFGDVHSDQVGASVESWDAEIRPTLSDSGEAATVSPEVRLAELEGLLDLLTGSEGKMSSDVADERWASLTAGAIAFVERPDEATVDELDRMAVLVRAAVGHRLPVPEPRPNDTSAYPSWSRSDVRTNATIALMGLARAGRSYPEVGLLAADPVAAVRYQVMSRLAFLMAPDRGLAIEIAKRASATEDNRGVLVGLLHSLGTLVYVIPDEATAMLEQLLDRIPDDQVAHGIRASSAALLATLSVGLNQPRATEILDAFDDDPPAHMEEIEAVTGALRTSLALGSVPGSEADAERRRRAIARLIAFVRAARRRMTEVAARPVIVAGIPWSEAESIEWQKCARIASAVAQETYFGSLAYEANKGHAGDADVSADRMERFYREGRVLLVDLATIGWPQATHHLIQTLRALVRVDPIGVLELAVQAIRSGREGGYEYESLAVGEVVTIVEDYLTNHRGELLANHQAVGQLVEILDGFVRLGWEPAVRLTYRLGDIYR